MVIAVNGWMNHPTGFRLSGREGRRRRIRSRRCSATATSGTSWCTCTSPPTWSPGSSSRAPTPSARLRGRWGRYEQTALAIPLAVAVLASRRCRSSSATGAAATVAAAQPTKLAAFEGLAHTTKGAPVHILGWYANGRVEYGIPIPRLLSLLAFHNPNATVRGPRCRPRRRPAARERRAGRVPDDGRHRQPARAALRRLPRRSSSGASACPSRVWFYRALVAAGPLALVALICGWVATEVGRQPWVVYRVMRTEQAVTGAGGIPVGYATLALVYLGLAVAVGWTLVRLAPMHRSPRGGLSDASLRPAADLRARRARVLRRARGRRLRRRLLGAAPPGAGRVRTRSATTRTRAWRPSGRRTTSG